MGEGERYLFLVRRLPQVLISCMSVLRQSTSALCCGFSLFLFYFYFFYCYRYYYWYYYYYYYFLQQSSSNTNHAKGN